MLNPNLYALGDEHSIGSESWEVEPTVAIRGSSAEANIYLFDGVDVSDIDQGTVVAFDIIDEVTVTTNENTAEYDDVTGAILNYRDGGTGVVNILTKSSGNEFRGGPFASTDESLNGLSYDEAGTLWGAGMAYGDSGPAPLLGFFNEDGTFVPVDNPFDDVNGFFQGIEFMGIGFAFGNTMPNGIPSKPLLAMSYDAGRTWASPLALPWDLGTIDAVQYVDPYLSVAGETPDGAAFSYSTDGGNTWTMQTMPDATYIWDMDIARVALSIGDRDRIWFLGAALGTRYLEDGSKESIVYRTLDGLTWEELWRIPGHGGAIDFDALGDGKVGMVQNGPEGSATFSVYSAQAFFGAENLICDVEIVSGEETATVNEPLTLQLAVRGPWGGTIAADTVVWTTDAGDLVVDAGDAYWATLTLSEPSDATVTCALPDFDLKTSQVITVKPYGD